MTATSTPYTSTPSRHANPFATCWTRPGTLPYRFASEQSAERLVSNLAEQNWRGAIIGPHGSGKSTLLESLKPALAAAGLSVATVALHDGQRRLPRIEFDAPNNRLLIIDGYEQLARLERARISLLCRTTNTGLLVTSHSRTHLPTLIQLAPDRRLVEQLVAELCANMSTNITTKDVAASHACHGSNVREVFFDLYDRHEERRRSTNLAVSAS